MNGPHDLGGTHGFGPVVAEADEPVFHADWERRVFGMAIATWGDPITAEEFRHGAERMDPVRYLASSYYEKWLFTLETVLVEKGVLDAAELEARRRELRADPAKALPRRADPAVAERLLQLVDVGSGQRAGGEAPRFRRGDEVVTRNAHPPGHTRLPRYARGKQGVVDRVYPAFAFPDAGAAGLGERPEHVYSVRFDGQELWGESAEPGTRVHLDLWESYLRPRIRST